MSSDRAPSRLPGVCVWLTGPSGGGKSTITRELVRLLEDAGRTVSVLDVVPLLRKQRWERTSEGKLLRKAFVAGEIVRHGGVAVCVTVSARRRTREAAREMIGADSFVEVLVEAPAEVTRARKSARRNRPPLTKRVRHAIRRLAASVVAKGRVSYEPPGHPDVAIDTTRGTPEEAARAVVDVLVERGFVAAGAQAEGPDAAASRDTSAGAEATTPEQTSSYSAT